MTALNLPSRDALKAQAKRLRSALSDSGPTISHSKALEAVAQQWGYRDWNTLSAASDDALAPRLQIGQSVSGMYLGHAFTGQIKAISRHGASHARLTLVFDDPVDVVASEHFSALRRQINATVNAQGRTVEKTSDGQPHLVLHL
ncbi:MAG: glyoxalase superfamily protein [Roseovarius sp.]